MAGYFAIFLVVITLASGLIWLIDARFHAPKRREEIALALKAAGHDINIEAIRGTRAYRRLGAAGLSTSAMNSIIKDLKLGDGEKVDITSFQEMAPQPAIAETAQSIFPILAAITIFRSFLFEPFQIPTGSMMPTMLVGDFILVQKYTYGVHDPIWRKELITTGSPERGDIAVFKFPGNENIDYIKRVVGLPGDRVVYYKKQLFVQPSCERSPEACDKLVPMEITEVQTSEFINRYGTFLQQSTEQLGDVSHQILVDPTQPELKRRYYQQPGTKVGEWIIPKDKYFLIGDNRDNSEDSRFWGFVSEDQLVGKAVFIWMSFVYNDGAISWLPNWAPVDIRFSRLGSVQ